MDIRDTSCLRIDCLPFELLCMITDELPIECFASFLLTSRYIYDGLHQRYIRKAFSTYVLYPTGCCVAALLKKIKASQQRLTYLNHLKINLRCPQFSKEQVEYLCSEYPRGGQTANGSIIPDPSSLLPHVGLVSKDNCKPSGSFEDLVEIFKSLKNLDTIEFLNTRERIQFKDCKYDNNFGDLTISQLGILRNASVGSLFLEDFSLADIVPWAFNALYEAERPINSVLCTLSPNLEGLKWLHQESGVSIPKFPRSEQAVAGYQRVFGNLKVLELRVRAFNTDFWTYGIFPAGSDTNPEDPSPWFESLKTLEELYLTQDNTSKATIRRNLGEGSFLAYPLRINATLPRLRLLKLRKCELQFDTLAIFIVANKTLRSLILEENEYYEQFGFNFASTRTYGDSFKAYTLRSWTNFFTNLRTYLDLEYFAIDIPGKPATEYRTELIYFEICGRWDEASTRCTIKPSKDSDEMLIKGVAECFDHVKMILSDAVKEYRNWDLRTGRYSKGPGRYHHTGFLLNL